jgi:internalin A
MRIQLHRDQGGVADLSRETAIKMMREAERVFICYAHADLRITRWLRRRIVRLRRPRPNTSVFLDQDTLLPGSRVTREMVDGVLAAADLVVLVCGATTASRAEVNRELQIALGLQRAGRQQLLPVIVKPHVRLPNGVDYTFQGIFLTRLFPERLYTRVGVTTTVLLLILSLTVGAFWGMPRWRHERAVDDLKAHGAEVTVLTEGVKAVFYAGSQYSDVALPQLQGLTDLREIDLSETAVTDNGLAVLPSLPRVHTLNLGETTISDDGLAHIGRMKSLRSLTLTNCRRLTSRGFAYLQPLTELKTLIVDDTTFADRDLAMLSSFSGLEVLSLERTAITDAGLPHLHGARGIKSLYLNRTAVSDSGLANLAPLMNLRILSLNETQVHGSGLADLSSLKDLRDLQLRSTLLDDSVAPYLHLLPALRELDLSSTAITSTTLQQIGQLRELTGLWLIDVGALTDTSVTALQPLTKLRELYIGGTRVGDEGLRLLARMPSLRTLWVVTNPITDAGLAAVASAGTGLVELNVHGTQVSDAAMAKVNAQERLRVIKRQP